MAFLQPAHDLRGVYPKCIGFELVTFDAENVLTPYGDPAISHEAFDLIARVQDSPWNKGVAVATNNQDQVYLDAMRDQLPGIPVFSATDYDNKKVGPSMFFAAAGYYNIDPQSATHVDDQYLSFRGARMAGFGGGVLLKAQGGTGHIGVRAGRMLDGPIRTGLRVRQSVAKIGLVSLTD